MTKIQNEMLSALDQMKDMAAMLTGMKQQLLDQGWSEANAELIVLHSLTAAK